MPVVLVVDDDPLIRELHRLNLEFRGYEVVDADGGEAALACARQRRPDVIILDLQMPGMNGWTTLEHLRAVDGIASVPVVMLTALADDTNEERARDLGVAAFVGKPVSVDDLEQVLRRVLST